MLPSVPLYLCGLTHQPTSQREAGHLVQVHEKPPVPKKNCTRPLNRVRGQGGIAIRITITSTRRSTRRRQNTVPGKPPWRRHHAHGP